MAKESVSKLVSKGAKATKNVVTGVAKGAVGVAKGATKTAVGVAKGATKLSVGVAKTATKTATNVVGTAASSTDKIAQNVASTTTKTTSKAVSKFTGLCNLDNIIPCVTALTLVAYIVIVSPTTVLDMFSTRLGKALSMIVVLIALLFDVKLGVMLGLAVILSISLASVNKDLYESYNGGVLERFETEDVYDASENEVGDVDLGDLEAVDEDDEVMPSPAPAPAPLADPEWTCTRMEKREDFVSGSDPSEPYDVTGVDTTVCKFAPFSNDS
uniref:Uncharacterized protein n=1 Tax=viral metagenome TaxID=1070528 RepID=A0A6C0AUX4_9ZZZZ|tara:strand:+ start:307 stop:1119 length:813 start_codon:yes stop_codon:yes gene_type:complete